MASFSFSQALHCRAVFKLTAASYTRYVYRTIEQNLTEGFGASFINCFGDPGVIAARCKADFLVFGGFEPAVLFALGLADRVGIITVLDNVQPKQCVLCIGLIVE